MFTLDPSPVEASFRSVIVLQKAVARQSCLMRLRPPGQKRLEDRPCRFKLGINTSKRCVEGLFHLLRGRDPESQLFIAVELAVGEPEGHVDHA